MATEKERKLQIGPVVQESVVHNARVSQYLPYPFSRSYLLAYPSSKYKLLPLGPLNRPLPNLLPLRHRLRHPRSRVLLRLYLLHPRDLIRLLPCLASTS